MPQPLSRPQPTSSVAAMLERGVGASVVAKTQSPAGVAPVSATRPEATPSHPESCTIPRQFLLSPAADKTLKRLQAVFAEATGLELRQSELLRALLLATDQILPEIQRHAVDIGPLRRPKNGAGSEALQAELEQRIAMLFSVRRLSP